MPFAATRFSPVLLRRLVFENVLIAVRLRSYPALSGLPGRGWFVAKRWQYNSVGIRARPDESRRRSRVVSSQCY